MLVSGVQNSDAVLHIGLVKKCILVYHKMFQILFHYRLIQDIEYTLYRSYTDIVGLIQ